LGKLPEMDGESSFATGLDSPSKSGVEQHRFLEQTDRDSSYRFRSSDGEQSSARARDRPKSGIPVRLILLGYVGGGGTRQTRNQAPAPRRRGDRRTAAQSTDRTPAAALTRG
jgi:hypothetical protein